MREAGGVIGFVPHLRRPERKEGAALQADDKTWSERNSHKHQKGEAQHEVVCGSRRLCQRNERVHRR